LFVCRYSKPEEYGIVEVPLPKLRDNDVLIKVKACGVCGTDLHIHEGEFIAKVWQVSYIQRCSWSSPLFHWAVLKYLDGYHHRLNSPFLRASYITEANFCS
jgi:hypothetical protein